MTVTVEMPEEDTERQHWLAALEATLRKTWDNPADEVFNELLTK